MPASRVLTVASLLNSVNEGAWLGQVCVRQGPGHPGALSRLMLPASPWGEGRNQPCPARCFGLTGRGAGRQGNRGAGRGGQAEFRPVRWELGSQGACRAWMGRRELGASPEATQFAGCFRTHRWPSFPGERATALFTLLWRLAPRSSPRAKNSARAATGAAPRSSQFFPLNFSLFLSWFPL